MKNNKKNKFKNFLSLTYKENENIDKNFVLSSYGTEHIVINNNKYKLPLCILGNNIYSFKRNIKHIADINVNLIQNLMDEFYKIYEEIADVVLIGLTENLTSSLLELKSTCMKKKIPVDLMNFDSACRTTNILNADKRKSIVIMI